MSRDRDVRNAIVAALQATGVFDTVNVSGLPEAFGVGASNGAAAFIEPDNSSIDERLGDTPLYGALVVTSRCRITFAYRASSADDAQTRDEAAENLVEYAMNALNGVALADLTSPQLSRFMSWQWAPAAAPERRIVAVFQYAYIIQSWDGFDTTT
jgi:hypothetical protein